MALNYIQVELGGEKRGLKYGLGALKHIKNLTSADPFALTAKGASDNIEDQIEFAAIVFYAGLLSNCDSKKQEPDFTIEDVTRWVEEMPTGLIKHVVEFFGDAYKTDSPASLEGSADTRA
jgi:hypothetical protein